MCTLPAPSWRINLNFSTNSNSKMRQNDSVSFPLMDLMEPYQPRFHAFWKELKGMY